MYLVSMYNGIVLGCQPGRSDASLVIQATGLMRDSSTWLIQTLPTFGVKSYITIAPIGLFGSLDH